jgi:hypothetical protein
MTTDVTQHKEDVQAALRSATLGVLETYIERLHMEGAASLDDLRKASEFLVKSTGAEIDKKIDANAGLPVFNFVFQNGGMAATMVSAPMVEVIENEALPMLDRAPPAKPARAADPVDMAELMGELDDMLGTTA